ncbi:hypothetical protein [Silanimonas sp.]|jgi:hypothetical protein|uniref:hypothetical protein n=1 Tax=Silanimonas sp. TaxID=1929290 RepID=UPI0037C78619
MSTASLLAAAAALALVTGIVHSYLGERLIFRHLRGRSLVPSLPAPPLGERHVRILWATWHLASILGWVLASLLWRIAQQDGAAVSTDWLLKASGGGFFAGALLVLVGTRGRHPGWIALAAVAVLSWLGLP